MIYRIAWQHDVEAETLTEALRKAINLTSQPNSTFMVNGQPEQMKTPLALISFTTREQEVMELLADSLSNKEIGKALGIEERTVKAHIAKLLRKTQCRTRIQLATKIYTQRLQEEVDELKSRQSAN